MIFLHSEKGIPASCFSRCFMRIGGNGGYCRSRSLNDNEHSVQMTFEIVQNGFRWSQRLSAFLLFFNCMFTYAMDAEFF